MPTTFEFSASQSASHVYLDVPLPAEVSAKELDITLTDAYISISSPSHILLLDFKFSVLYEQAVCKLKNRVMKIEIPKEYHGQWDQLFLLQNETEENLISRRSAAFDRLKSVNKQKADEQAQKEAETARAVAEKEAEVRQVERARMRQLEQNEEENLRVTVEDLRTELEETNNEVEEQNIPAPRSQQTTVITAEFTKRKYAVPARDNRDMYYDDFQGEMIADIKSQPVDIMLIEAVNYIKRPTPEYESALDICAEVIKRAPTYLKGILLMSEIYLEQGRFDESLLLTSEMMRIISNSTDNPQLAGAEYSREMESKINALHAVSLCGAGKYRDALRYMDSAYLLNKQNERLGRDLEMLKRIVNFVDTSM